MSVVNLYLLNVNEKAKLARKKYKEKMCKLLEEKYGSNSK